MTENHLLFDPFDKAMRSIFNSMVDMAMSNASLSVEQIFNVSSHFLSKDSHTQIRKFHDLYLNGGTIAQKTEDINEDVNRLMDEIKDKMEKGEELDFSSDDKKQDRLSISALQKKLEAIICIEEGVREKLQPVLSSMQFEDSMRQRMEHLKNGWKLVFDALQENKSDFSDLAANIGKSLSSQNETNAFYNHVMKETPPEALEERSVFLEF